MTRGTTSGIPKNKVQQTRLLHLAKGRKVSRKVICDAASPERELRQDDDDDHDGAHAGCARARFSPARYGAQRAQVSVTNVQPHPGVKSVKSARADREKAFKEKHSWVDFLMQGFFQYYN
jgi:hypothetical protein